MNQQPSPPRQVTEALPTELIGTIAQQDIGTLEECREWIDSLIIYKRQLITDSERLAVVVEGTTGEEILTSVTENNRSGVETRKLMGSFDWQFIACSNESCSCTSGQPNDFHGPYLRRRYLDGSGHRMTEYIPQSDRRQELVRHIMPKPSASDISNRFKDNQ